MSDKNEIEALINLLGDNDVSVVRAVNKALLDKGERVIPALEKAWENSLNESFQARVEQLVHDIQFQALLHALIGWAHEQTPKLMDGAFLISKYAFPDLHIDDLQEKIAQIVQLAQDIVMEQATPLEQIKALNHVLFNVHGLAQNSGNFYAPQNSFLNLVLDKKKGNPISLSIIYILVGQAIGLPIYGVNLPKNFIVVFGSKDPLKNKRKENLHFYINPYNRGAVLSAKEIDFFVKQQKLPHLEEYYLPCSNLVIVRRIVQNLIYAYQQQGQESKVKDFERLKHVLEKRLEELNSNANL